MDKLCERCKKPIGNHNFRADTNDYSGITFHWHNDHGYDCWQRVWNEVAKEYLLAIYKAKRKVFLLKGGGLI